MNPRCPLSSSFVFPNAELVKTIGEDLPAKSLPTAGDGVDILPRPLARPDKAAEG